MISLKSTNDSQWARFTRTSGLGKNLPTAPLWHLRNGWRSTILRPKWIQMVSGSDLVPNHPMVEKHQIPTWNPLCSERLKQPWFAKGSTVCWTLEAKSHQIPMFLMESPLSPRLTASIFCLFQTSPAFKCAEITIVLNEIYRKIIR